jgi:hypothetical protein
MMASIRVRHGLFGLVVGQACTAMGCAVAPEGPGKGKGKVKAPKELTEGKESRRCAGCGHDALAFSFYACILVLL